MYFASLVAAVAAMYSASHDDCAINDCVRAPALIRNPSSMISHEDTDLPVGRSPAQSLSVNTVRVEHALFCTCNFSQQSIVPRRFRKRRFDAMRSDFEGFAR